MKLLCTLGPKVFNEKSIKRLTELGVDLFRINLSHTKPEEIESRRNQIVEAELVSRMAAVSGDPYLINAAERQRAISRAL